MRLIIESDESLTTEYRGREVTGQRQQTSQQRGFQYTGQSLGQTESAPLGVPAPPEYRQTGAAESKLQSADGVVVAPPEFSAEGVRSSLLGESQSLPDDQF